MAVGLTIAVLVILVGISPAANSHAMNITVAGPEEVTDDELVTFNATVDENEDVTVENYTLQVITTKTNESVNVTFASNCTVLDVEPDEGVVGNHGIDAARLNETLNVVCMDVGTGEGYGYGYGYGYGDAADGTAIAIQFHTSAFEPDGTYALQLDATTTDGETFASNVAEFEVSNSTSES